MATRRTAASTAVAKKPTTAVATSAVPDYMKNALTGEGVSKKADDNVVPFIYILQKGSAQVNKKEDGYIEGAEAGDIWLRPDVVVKGDEGILFQPCGVTRDWVEWMPERGGRVTSHPYDDNDPNLGRPDDATAEPDPKNPNRQIWVRDNGNVLVDTRYECGMVHIEGEAPRPFLIPLSSTGHTFAKTFNSLRLRKQYNGQIAAAFSHWYRLTTNWTKNQMGDWYNWSVKDEGWVPSAEILELGRSLYNSFAKGEKRMEDAPAPEADEDKIPF